MSKAVILSIRPEYCELIASGKKTVEVRKTIPKINTPFKCYIYCTKDKHGWFDFSKKVRLDGKVIGEFVCDNLCLSVAKAAAFCPNSKMYGWHISDLVIYDKPKKLSAFLKVCDKEFGNDCVLNMCKHLDSTDLGEYACDRRITRPPQSWCYVEELKVLK